MIKIEIQTDEEVVEELADIAKVRHKTMDEIVNEALTAYLRKKPSRGKDYSFIGIGHSGKGDISVRVDEALEQGANRREGWSLSE